MEKSRVPPTRRPIVARSQSTATNYYTRRSLSLRTYVYTARRTGVSDQHDFVPLAFACSRFLIRIASRGIRRQGGDAWMVDASLLVRRRPAIGTGGCWMADGDKGNRKRSKVPRVGGTASRGGRKRRDGGAAERGKSVAKGAAGFDATVEAGT